MPLLLEIVTPDAKVYSETVDEVGLPTTEGRVHILPHHIPIIAKLDAGEILVRRGKEDEMLAVGSGFGDNRRPVGSHHFLLVAGIDVVQRVLHRASVHGDHHAGVRRRCRG